jgi:DNA-binding response OmpR family regulator
MQTPGCTKSGIIILKGFSMPIKVLTIDDDSSMTEMLGILLRNNGMEVSSCNSGSEGIALTISEKPDIILLDLMMPGTDGWEVCRKLRSLTSTPIAILSALDDPDVISAALDSGADDYMTKPVPSSVLLAHIKNLTRRHIVENDSSTMMRQLDLSIKPVE